VTELPFSVVEISALLQVMLIDVALSGDNAIVIALAASGLPAQQRRRAIAIGIGAAIALRVVFAVTAVYLLEIPGLLLVGGLMLGWVCVRMWWELRSESKDDARHVEHTTKSLREAVLQITLADVSMSLDNVLAVAGAARDHVFIMATGLMLAILLMAFAANLIAPLLQRFRWLSYAGLALIAFVAVRMVYEGSGLSHVIYAAGP
jgi:YjbE family integral membrane protein